MTPTRSEDLFAQARELIPGGVNSPVRAFRSMNTYPRFIERGEGAYLMDVDGRRYLDYVGSWGPLILGHAHPAVISAVKEAAEKGTSFGAPSPLEVELAREIVEAVPGVETVRFVNSGTEATMSALRLARAYTGRRKIVKFAGCYHGHADLLLAKAGSGVATLGLPGSAGVPEAVVADTLVLPYNDTVAAEETFGRLKKEIAAVIVEPVAANMGVVPPQPVFLQALRAMTAAEGSLLVFDEVITGFRVARGGAQERYGVRPDLTCLGKIIGGGLPVGAYGGRREIMSLLAPEGPVYQAGTLSGNPLAMAAGLATLGELRDPEVYERLERLGAQLECGLRQAAGLAGLPLTLQRVGSLLTVFFTPQDVWDYETALSADTEGYALFFREMLERGIYLAPSQFEAAFISLAHTEGDIERTVQAAAQAFGAVAEAY